MKNFIRKIKNRETKFYDGLYQCLKAIRNFSFPCIRPLHSLFRHERKFRLSLWHWLLKTFYYVPMFKSACKSCGKNLNIIDGFPYVDDSLDIQIGNNVRIYGSAGFGGFKVFESPQLIIGDNTFIGPDVRIGVGKKIQIGNHCLIAARVFMADHDGHPLNAEKRRQNLPPKKELICPITIEDDAWIGEGVFLGKGVTIGKGAVVAARAVVTKDVAPFTIVGGNPAKLIKKIEENEI